MIEDELIFLIDTSEETIDIFETEIEDIIEEIQNELERTEEIKDIYKLVKEEETRMTNKDNRIELAVQKYKQTNSEEYFNEVFKHYDNILKRWSKRSTSNYIEQEELYSMSLETFVRTMQNWKVEKNVKFNTYFWTNIRYGMSIRGRYKKAKKRKADDLSISIHSPISRNKNEDNLYLEAVIKDDNNEMDNIELKTAFINMNIKERDKEIICYMIDGYNATQIAKMLDVTPACLTMTLRRLGKSKAGDMIKKILLNS